MDVYQLQYFKTIAECSSLVEAAKRLHVSQPSLSRCIHKMEEELGTPLFDRVGRNIVLMVREMWCCVMHKLHLILLMLFLPK